MEQPMTKLSAAEGILKAAKRGKRLLEKRSGAKVHILHVDTAHRATTGEPVYRVHAAPDEAPNEPKWALVLDAGGNALEASELQKQEGVDVFARASIGIVPRKLRPAQAGAEPRIDPEVNFITLREGEAVRESVTVTVPSVPPLQSLDVYFLADVTGSMMPFLTELQDSVNAILGSIRATGADVAFGVGSYRDFPGPADLAFMAQQPMTMNDADVVAAIAAWTASGGGDLPEGQLFALDRIADDVDRLASWVAAGRRVVR
jgi:hypothetical protein